VTEILIVGAGIAGLTAASELQRAGREVLVIESSANVGGRVASHQIQGATFDHGAQFITARDPRFVAAVDDWRQAGVAQEWYRSAAHRGGGHPRWRGDPAMAAIPAHLARRAALRLQTALVSLQLEPPFWVAELSSGETLSARAVLLTPPVPVSLALLDAGKVTLAPGTRARLEQAAYERCLAVMAVLDGPSGLPAPGGFAPREGPLAWIADSQMKGISPVPAVTLHATGAFSLAHWEDDRREAGSALVRAAQSWLRSSAVTFQVRGWPYSRAVSLIEPPCLTLHPDPPLLIAGDAFVAPRVEGAALSGWAAAEALKGMHGDG
jgi:predicted NAD/FAD-dependent oxidoreductase